MQDQQLGILQGVSWKDVPEKRQGGCGPSPEKIRKTHV